MPQYVIIGTHEPSQCPGANGKMREVFQKLVAEAPTAGEKLGVKLVIGPLHLDPAHKVLVVAEAPSAEAVRDFLQQSRLGQIQAIELYLTTPLNDLFQNAPSPLY
jgi:hypothetical protein